MAKINWNTEEDIVREAKLREIEHQAKVSYQRQPEYLNKFLLNQLSNMIDSGTMSEEEALEYIQAYPPFEVGIAYKLKDKVQYEGVVYEVIKAHTSQIDRLPDSVPSLFNTFLSGTIKVEV